MKKMIEWTIMILMILLMSGCKMTISNANLIEGLRVKFNGVNGKGTIQVTKNNVKIRGLKKENKEKFLSSLEYAFDSSSNLSNGDKIRIIVTYDEELANAYNINVIQNETIVEVKNLSSPIETEEYKGYQIPKNWNLAGYEKDAYIEYLKSLEEDDPIDKIAEATSVYWLIGKSTEETYLTNKKFYYSDFRLRRDANESAYAYGANSSQMYRVEAIMENNEIVGCECIFKTMNNKIIDSNNVGMFLEKYGIFVIAFVVVIIVLIILKHYQDRYRLANEV